MLTKELVKLCAEEVHRQGRGPIQVHWMVEACLYAKIEFQGYTNDENITDTLYTIRRLGHLVERHDNNIKSWRQVDTYSNRSGHVFPSAYKVPSLMSRWALDLKEMTPEEAYKSFEEIHPFTDGNGRVGVIIYNCLKNSWDKPLTPPDYWGVHTEKTIE